MGKGGGGGGHTPVEAKESGRSKQLIRINEVISEGEVQGLADDLKSVYFDNTPVQDVLPGFDTSEKEVSVSTRVRKNLPITRTITDNKVSRLRLTLGVQSLFKQEDNGDTNGTQVEMNVYIGERVYPVTFNGKYSSQYLRSYVFTNLPRTPFTVRVERVTEDSTSQRKQNNTLWRVTRKSSTPSLPTRIPRLSA